MLSFPDGHTVCRALLQMARWMYVGMGWMIGLLIRPVAASRDSIIVTRESTIDYCRADEDEVYFSADEFDEDDAECSTLLHDLPYDLVVSHVWPRVVDMASAQDICRYRLISTQWRDLVATSQHWRALQPLLIGTDARPLWYGLGLDLDLLMYTPEYLICEYHRAQDWYVG